MKRRRHYALNWGTIWAAYEVDCDIYAARHEDGDVWRMPRYQQQFIERIVEDQIDCEKILAKRK